MSLLCLALLVRAQAAAGPATEPRCVTAAPWRRHATEADRQRLRDARAAWTEALGPTVATAAAAPVDPLFDPDRALETPLPPAGAYRCRLVGVGAGAAAPAWGRCEVGVDSLVKLDGPQRPTGKLFADSPTRGVFLGTIMLGDESRPVGYGRDRMRDLIGVVERIDAQRWRVALPRRAFGSTLDVIELVPA